MLEVTILWEDENARTFCAAWVVPAGAGATLRVGDDGEFKAVQDEHARLEVTRVYKFPANKDEWKQFYHELRKAARAMGTNVKIEDISSHLYGPEPIPFPDSKYPIGGLRK